jgi:DNA-directed RNA polymerase specialized sigma24 family protein
MNLSVMQKNVLPGTTLLLSRRFTILLALILCLNFTSQFDSARDRVRGTSGPFLFSKEGSHVALQTSMPQSTERHPQWWDREVDDAGRPIRPDVRSAAIRVWKNICDVVARIRGNSAEAPELLDKAVGTVSAYLNKKHCELGDPGGLLVVAVHRAATRLSRRESVVPVVGGTSELAEMLRAPDWTEVADRRLILQRLAATLLPLSQAILRLRLKDMTWTEIGKLLGMDASIARSRFWQDVRRAHLELFTPPKSSGKK